MTSSVSDGFDPARWQTVPGFEELTDLTYHRGLVDGQPAPWLRIAFDRPEVRNAFRPHTVDELISTLRHASLQPDVVAVLLAGNGPSPKDGGYAFCSGGDQRYRGTHGYQVDRTDQALTDEGADQAPPARLHVIEAQHLIRTMAKVVIAVVDGWAAGGGHSLAVVADLTLACRQHGRFKQTDATVGSFDAGYGAALLGRQVGQKRARQIFFLADTYTAEQAEAWGAINQAVDHAQLEAQAIAWAGRVADQSPQAIRLLKFAFNLADDGLAGQQMFAAEATRLAYTTAEAQEGRDAFLQGRAPNWEPHRRQIL